jgi:hypothetical protein
MQCSNCSMMNFCSEITWICVTLVMSAPPLDTRHYATHPARLKGIPVQLAPRLNARWGIMR